MPVTHTEPTDGEAGSAGECDRPDAVAAYLRAHRDQCVDQLRGWVRLRSVPVLPSTRWIWSVVRSHAQTRRSLSTSPGRRRGTDPVPLRTYRRPGVGAATGPGTEPVGSGLRGSG